VLLDEVRAPGIHQAPWDGTNASGAFVPSGVYFYSLTAGSVTQSRRMILLK
jgi:flagellar hook assembly protein FlgD